MLTLLAALSIAPLAPQDPSPPKIVHVFLLAGQSNMEGQAVVDLDHPEHYNGGRGTLARVLDTAAGARFGHWRTPSGAWAERDDVFVWYRSPHEEKIGPLSIGYAVYGGKHHFGPELELGRALGERYDEPVLLVKAAWGGKSIHADFRPPRSGGVTGPFYGKLFEELRAALADEDEKLPALAGHTPRLAGFVWFQGWNDMVSDEATAEYEDNLVNLILDVRAELSAPELPVVIGETGNCAKTTFLAAQAAVATREELGGHVAFVPTQAFLRKPEDSPNKGHGHHWFGNAESYLLIGEALGAALVELLGPRPGPGR